MAQIGVYFQSLNTKKIVEEPKYTVNNIDLDMPYFSAVSLTLNNIGISNLIP